MLQFDRDGAQHFPSALGLGDWLAFADNLAAPRAGMRLFGVPQIHYLLQNHSCMQSIAKQCLGSTPMPVRAIYFDKSAENNWSLNWHQDRTIAVKQKAAISGFGPWTVKQGVTHVEPPFALLEKMMTVRLHLDAVIMDNAPLKIVTGSHRLGKITEHQYAKIVATYSVKSCLAEAGDVWAYSTPVLHASDASKSLSRRRVIQIDYSADPLPPPLEWLGV